MDPQTEKNPGLHLPQPSPGEGEFFHGKYEEMQQKSEFGIAAPEARAMTPPALPVVNPVNSSSVQMPQHLPADDLATYASATPLDDAVGDELDKEWVNKAKMIVEKTKDDPYIQSHEIGKVKADYLRIRFNKHIKVAQDKAL